MNDSSDDNLAQLLVHPANDDIWPFQELAGSWYQAWPPHICELRSLEPKDPRFNSVDQFKRGSGILLDDPRESAVEVVASSGVECYLHAVGLRRSEALKDLIGRDCFSRVG